MSEILTITMNPAIDLSVTAERVAPTHKIRCEAERREPGGGGINVARVICRLGGDCRALFPAGGTMGDLLVRLVHREGISAVPIDIAGQTRESFTANDRHSGEQYRFVLEGPTLSDAEWKSCLAELETCDPPRFLVASGSLPPGCPPSFHGDLARLAAKVGAKLVVDSSGESLAAALDEGVYLCKPSLSELESVVGRSLPDEQARLDAAASLVSAGKAVAVALTLGEEGALLVTGEGCWHAPRVDVEVKSAVGAGDSFLAGFIWGLRQGEAWPGALAWGVAAGTAAVMTPGSELAVREDIERVRDLVTVEAVS